MLAALTKFVVVGIQRSGTTLVTTSLESHPAIHCAGELFKLRPARGTVDVKDSGYLAYRNSAFHLKVVDCLFRHHQVKEFLDRYFDQPGFTAVGFKLMQNQTHRGRFPMVVSYLIDQQISVIHVTRRNVFKTHLSRLMAQHSGVYHATRTSAGSSRVHVPTERLEESLITIDSQNRKLKETFAGATPYLPCTYEDYAAEPHKENQKLLSFLGLQPTELHSPLVKVVSDDIALVVENLDEVRQSLQGTIYEECVR